MLFTLAGSPFSNELLINMYRMNDIQLKPLVTFSRRSNVKLGLEGSFKLKTTLLPLKNFKCVYSRSGQNDCVVTGEKTNSRYSQVHYVNKKKSFIIYGD